MYGGGDSQRFGKGLGGPGSDFARDDLDEKSMASRADSDYLNYACRGGSRW